ncbi:hypothetical protein DSO57_1020956 [Entomophthora muscae]|uniref:Uncharacterized protein n=1 Tax=Entomophthora muscae TaxID=34485 RepID=A0ACC2SSS9_9FUNG|nr:hypothetical protein DSO57_1020956 [Entomophthora muscae]
MRSLTCNDLEFPVVKTAPTTPSGLACPMPLPSGDPIVLVPEEGWSIPESAPKHASWLLSGMVLMGLDSYFPWLSAVSSLWTLLQAAIPVLHWMVSWWALPPGWEPNLVSLASLSHTFELVYGTQPNIIQALTGPKLEIPSEVSPRSEPHVIEANSKQTEKENERLQKTFVSIRDRHEVGDKVWVMNVDKSKLQPKKVGPAIILKVNNNCKFTATSGFEPLNLSLLYQERSQNARQTPPFVE